ncbi:MAG: hypothetical protein QME66_05490 [Candidatus Eisenbacteria bacterium]|nr:hypothetical protein [Candidatus Eisenbacteria bacterium]
MSLPSFKGKRSYILAVLIGLVAVAAYLGYIDAAERDFLFGLLGAGGLASLRAAK